LILRVYYKHRVMIFVLFSDVGFDRYKLIVQVVVGEQRGEGVK